MLVSMMLKVWVIPWGAIAHMVGSGEGGVRGVRGLRDLGLRPPCNHACRHYDGGGSSRDPHCRDIDGQWKHGGLTLWLVHAYGLVGL